MAVGNTKPDMWAFLTLKLSAAIEDKNPGHHCRQIGIQVSNGRILRASAFPLEYLLSLSELPEQEFVAQYWKPAYDYLRRIEGYSGKPVLPEPDTYGNQYCCIDLAVRQGFVPTDVGARIIELRNALTNVIDAKQY